MKIKKILIYRTNEGEEPVVDWLQSVGDIVFRARIKSRIERLEDGNFGDCRQIDSKIYELRFFFGSGYRIYFGKFGNEVVLLLCGGDKKSQKKDIRKANIFYKDYYEKKYGGRKRV